MSDNIPEVPQVPQATSNANQNAEPHKKKRPVLIGFVSGIIIFFAFAIITFFQATNEPCDHSAGECMGGFAWIILLPFQAIAAAILGLIIGVISSIAKKSDNSKNNSNNQNSGNKQKSEMDRYRPYFVIIAILVAPFVFILLFQVVLRLFIGLLTK